MSSGRDEQGRGGKLRFQHGWEGGPKCWRGLRLGYSIKGKELKKREGDRIWSVVEREP